MQQWRCFANSTADQPNYIRNEYFGKLSWTVCCKVAVFSYRDEARTCLPQTSPYPYTALMGRAGARSWAGALRTMDKSKFLSTDIHTNPVPNSSAVTAHALNQTCWNWTSAGPGTTIEGPALRQRQGGAGCLTSE